MTTLEQQARDMLERAGVESAQSMTSGDLVEVANMMNEVRELRAALERARALLAEQAEVITANVWHIPPEYSARNIVMDAAAKMRELAAAPASGGAA